MEKFSKFDTYTATELGRAGATLVHLVRRDREELGHGKDFWADLILNWFTHACDVPGVVVDTSRHRLDRAEWANRTRRLDRRLAVPRRLGTNEFLQMDLFASRGPAYGAGYRSLTYWERALATPDARPLLAMEVEWKGKDRGSRKLHALHSAAKLAWVRAEVKVLVCASHANDEEQREIDGHLDDFAQLRRNARDHTPWLVIDVAYAKTAWTDRHRPTAWLVDERGAVSVSG